MPTPSSPKPGAGPKAPVRSVLEHLQMSQAPAPAARTPRRLIDNLEARGVLKDQAPPRQAPPQQAPPQDLLLRHPAPEKPPASWQGASATLRGDPEPEQRGLGDPAPSAGEPERRAPRSTTSGASLLRTTSGASEPQRRAARTTTSGASEPAGRRAARTTTSGASLLRTPGHPATEAELQTPAAEQQQARGSTAKLKRAAPAAPGAAKAAATVSQAAVADLKSQNEALRGRVQDGTSRIAKLEEQARQLRLRAERAEAARSAAEAGLAKAKAEAEQLRCDLKVVRVAAAATAKAAAAAAAAASASAAMPKVESTPSKPKAADSEALRAPASPCRARPEFQSPRPSTGATGGPWTPGARTPGTRTPGATPRSLPPVPAFRRPPATPALLLRRVGLPPKREEDQYEMSEQGDATDDEEAKNEDEEDLKWVPVWCKTYLDELVRQADVDPDTIFGCRAPTVNLDSVFPEEMCKAIDAERAPRKRKRGSSGNWAEDGVQEVEELDYKRRMGHHRGWDLRQKEEATAS